jgi:hypothetical protein
LQLIVALAPSLPLDLRIDHIVHLEGKLGEAFALLPDTFRLEEPHMHVQPESDQVPDTLRGTFHELFRRWMRMFIPTPEIIASFARQVQLFPRRPDIPEYLA